MTTSREPLLEVEGLTKHFPAHLSLFGRVLTTVKAVDGVSFAVEAGETLALVGESGCGKSTTGRLILRLLEPTAGRIRFAGQDVRALRPEDMRALRRAIQIIFQDPYASLNPRMTVGDILAEPLQLHGLAKGGARRARVAELLTLVGLRRSMAAAIPTNSQAGNASASALPGRSPSSRGSSSATSPSRRSTSRSRRR